MTFGDPAPLKKSTTAREWRWGDGLPPEPRDNLVETAAERRRRLREARLDQAFNVTVLIMAALLVLFILGCVAVWIYVMQSGEWGYCCDRPPAAR